MASYAFWALHWQTDERFTSDIMFDLHVLAFLTLILDFIFPDMLREVTIPECQKSPPPGTIPTSSVGSTTVDLT
jgi:hypothetical protein